MPIESQHQSSLERDTVSKPGSVAFHHRDVMPLAKSDGCEFDGCPLNCESLWIDVGGEA